MFHIFIRLTVRRTRQEHALTARILAQIGRHIAGGADLSFANPFIACGTVFNPLI